MVQNYARIKSQAVSLYILYIYIYIYEELNIKCIPLYIFYIRNNLLYNVKLCVTFMSQQIIHVTTDHTCHKCMN